MQYFLTVTQSTNVLGGIFTLQAKMDDDTVFVPSSLPESKPYLKTCQSFETGLITGGQSLKSKWKNNSKQTCRQRWNQRSFNSPNSEGLYWSTGPNSPDAVILRASFTLSFNSYTNLPRMGPTTGYDLLLIKSLARIQILHAKNSNVQCSIKKGPGCLNWTSSVEALWPGSPASTGLCLPSAGLCTTWLSSVCRTWSRPKAPSSTCPALTGSDQWVASRSDASTRLFQHRWHRSRSGVSSISTCCTDTEDTQRTQALRNRKRRRQKAQGGV